MKRNNILSAMVTTLFVVLMSVGQVAGQTQAPQNPPVRKYHLVDLGKLGVGSSKAKGINNEGEVVGLTSNHPDISAFQHAFLYANGYMQDIGALYNDSYNSYAHGINEQGDIVGYSEDLYLKNPHAFIYSKGFMRDLGTLGGLYSVANAINNQGHIVGWAHNTAGQQRAFVYIEGNMQDLGTPGESSLALAINKYGHIVGWFRVDNTAHAFLYSDGVVRDMGTHGGIVHSGFGINDNGYVITQVYLGNGRLSSFLYSNSSTQSLGTSGTQITRAYDINNNNEIVGGYSVGSGVTVRAFVYSNGIMNNLNDLLVDQNSGWILIEATAINDRGQIVGYGLTPAGQSHAFLLNPLPVEYENLFDTPVPKPVFGDYPQRQEGKDSLVLITHGWINRIFSPIVASHPSWVDHMSNNVSTYLNGNGGSTWQVFGYKWITNAWKVAAQDALANAKQEGLNLGSALGVQGWAHIHLIGHSTGAEVIQEASEWIKTLSPSTTVHCTFLDAYIGNDGVGITRYGKGADWSDNYFASDLFTGSVTEGCLSNAYNVDVKLLDPFKVTGISKFPSTAGDPVVLCKITGSSHQWPYMFYTNTIVGNTNSEYVGFGFPLSKEGGNWGFARNNYVTGNVPAHVLGILECEEEIPNTPRVWPNQSADFVTWPTIQSASGTIQKWYGALQLNPGSPVWTGTIITPTNPVNTISFDMKFAGTNGSASVLAVYWDTNIIGTIDELHVRPGFQHYSLSFPQAVANGSHVLGFRLDPYPNTALSSVILTNVVLTQIGVSQPFSLSLKTNTSNTLLYELKGESGFNYSVQTSSNLIDWMDIAQLVNTNGVVPFYDVDSTNHYRRFYRVIAPHSSF